MSSTSRNPGNWHWTSKDCFPWTKSYLSEKLIISAEKEGITASIVKLSSCSGDVDVAMRKGKVITIYDLEISLEFNGKIPGDIEVSGSITIPEVSHDNDEYLFNIEIFSETKENQIIKGFIRSYIVPELKERLRFLGQALIDAHGKDVLLLIDKNTASNPSTPNVSYAKSQNGIRASTLSGKEGVEEKTKGKCSIINTVEISENIDFQASTSQLYSVFLDHSRLEIWTRSKVEVDPKVGGKFSFFGGNVQGEFLELVESKLILQKWRLKTWPEGHYAELKLLFDQSIDGTLLRMKMSDVPVGQEDVVKCNFQEYYVKPIKTVFGYGSVL
ncbi:hypothetical protein PNEG_01722 [Pneumocystis murina B123]|uniref:Activator of Hsp90 ATPase AHSA1-like N-terminal domain-containing protein n=1 Tax=Pneumocystis murina (strain B123) TaxID=1069680 RepID=M7PHM9_PNEMU|nr:hypothetical protein PNEG_01722 [Pneumocystis murina B123]EMR09964.1 hypothetical protein PNEG_01722 [Pneumocystis murina B123]